MKNAKKITTIVLIAAMVLLTTTMLAACNETGQSYDPETRPFAMSISTPDGVFNPFFSTSAYDSSIVGMTQIGMLSTDSKGNITYGDNEPTVTKDYIVKETEEGGKKYTTYRISYQKRYQILRRTRPYDQRRFVQPLRLSRSVLHGFRNRLFNGYRRT